MSFWKYFLINSWMFLVWLIFPALFIWYWIETQENYIQDVWFTIGLCSAAFIGILIGNFVKWKSQQ